MKILLIHALYQLKGGEDTVVKQELALLSQFHTVEVLYFQNQSGIKGVIQFLSSIWNRSAARKVAAKINDFKPDVVHVHNWHFGTGPLIFRTISQMNIPIVHTVHNYRLLCPSSILLHSGKLFTDSLKARFPWKAVFKKVYRNSLLLTFWLAFVVWFHKKIGTWKLINSYVCLTSFAVDLFHDSNLGVSKKQFTVKPNFTYASKIINSNKIEEHFLFIGRLSAEKGITTLLEAFKGLPYELRIAGDGPLKDAVLLATKQVTNISYIGNLTNDEVVITLQKAKALIFPSVWFETFGLVNIEAFANHTPVLASNIGAPKSIVIDGYNGFSFEAGDIVSLRETIRKFEALSVLEKDNMALQAYQSYQSHYAPEMQMKYFEAIYNEVTNKAV